MSLVPMNFENEVTPLGAGVYKARVVGAEVKQGKTKDDGTPGINYVNWRLETFGSPEVNGKTLFHMTPLEGGFVTKLAEFHKAATRENIDKKQKQYDPEMLIGKEITVTLFMETYNGKTSPKVQAVAPLS